MNSTSPLRLWGMRVAFVLVALVIILGDLLPLQTLTRGWAGPDLVFCLALVWCVRRPEYVPMPLLAVTFLIADMLLSRPPGLMAALMLLACHNLETQMHRNREASFFGEWVRASMLIFGCVLAYRVILGILLVPTPATSLILFQALMTALFYPIVIAFSAFVFGVRLTRPGDYDSSLGQRT